MQNANVKALAQLVGNLYGDLLDFPFLKNSAPAPLTETSQKKSSLQQLKEECKVCNQCEYHIGRKNSVFGRGEKKAKVIFVGDFPSDLDDQKGEIFTGEQGELLSKMILAMKLKPEEMYFTNVFKCRPPTLPQWNEDFPQNCQAHLLEEFRFLEGKIVIALGGIAAKILARSEAPIQVLRKQKFDWEGRMVFCTHHPRDLLHSPAGKKEAWEDLQRVMKEMGSL
jgi:uracil-DNA glycosylase family 4